MNNLTLLFGVLLCLVAVNARHFADRSDESIENEEETLRRPKEHSNGPSRHRRRRWQSYGYDYPPPSYRYPDRRDYERNNQEAVLQRISQLLEEISAYIRRPPPPPPPPQPIYIPYPVYYPQIPRVICKPQNQNKTAEVVPDVPKRNKFDEMDPNQNWGLMVSNENDYDYSDGARPISFEPIIPKEVMKRPVPSVEHGSVQASAPTVQETTKAPRFADGARPISFEPIVPKQVMKRPAPSVEHGSAQASAPTEEVTTKAPRFADDLPSLSVAAPVPGACNAAILSCCSINDRLQKVQCFTNIGCSNVFDDKDACNKDSIQRALDSFKFAYSPMN